MLVREAFDRTAEAAYDLVSMANAKNLAVVSTSFKVEVRKSISFGSASWLKRQ